MAAPVARSAAAIALGAIVACGGAGGTSEAPSESPLAATRVAAMVTVEIFRALNDATAQVYVVQSLLSGANTIGGTQACMTADNRVSRRPSALANVPYSEASIQQRERLLGALGDYEAGRATIARNAPPAELAVALAGFQRTAFELNAVAGVHSSGDLFVDEGAATLVSLAARLRTAKDRAAMDALTGQARPTVAKLIGILRNDVRRNQSEALNATRSEVDVWLDYARATASGRPAHRLAPLPSCGEPIVPTAPATEMPRPAISTLDNMSEVIRSAVEDAQERGDALAAIQLDPIFAALLDLDAASSPAAIAAALQRLDAAKLEPQRDAGPLRNEPSAPAPAHAEG
jgi:hypothetical protein